MITKDQAKEILASIALADNLGDAREAVQPIANALGITIHDLHIDILRKKELLPEHLKD